MHILLSKDHYKDISTDPITNSASSECKSSTIGKTPDNDDENNNTRDAEIVVPLKHLNNFRKSLHISLIN